jgi:hypothetical protein
MKRKYKENNIVHHNFSCIFSYHVLLSFKFASFETGHKSVVFLKKTRNAKLTCETNFKVIPLMNSNKGTCRNVSCLTFGYCYASGVTFLLCSITLILGMPFLLTVESRA